MLTLSPHALQSKPHYTYVLMYPEDYPEPEKAGTVFYVGKGIRDRIAFHEQEAKRGVKSFKCNVIRLIWLYGKEVVRRKVAFFDTHEEACMHEIALIFFLPDLTNRTIGGDGIVGLVRTEEHKRKIREANMGKHPSEETRHKLIESHKGKRHSEESLHKLSEALKGKKHSENARRKMSEARKGIQFSEETRFKQSESHKGKRHSEETRRKRSESMRGKTLSASARQKLIEVNTGKHHSEETRRKLSDIHAIRIWPGFIAPDGACYENIVNLNAFCREHCLNCSCMGKLARGIQSQHKGWKSLTSHEKPQKVWSGFIAPDGTRYENIVGLRAFCQEHGLSYSHMREVYQGKHFQHKGWKALL